MTDAPQHPAERLLGVVRLQADLLVRGDVDGYMDLDIVRGAIIDELPADAAITHARETVETSAAMLANETLLDAALTATARSLDVLRTASAYQAPRAPAFQARV